jgi:bacillithiol biosynthesis cysteine-adding enzyme BshC
VSSVSRTSSAIPFGSLGNFSRTWHAIMQGRVPHDLFAAMPADMNSCRIAAERQRAQSRPWKELADLFEARGKSYGVPSSTLARLDALREGRAVMVVTGQQAGFLGGPLYTFLKAYHATRLAAELEDYLHLPVLPVFWLEGEDHDLEEVRHARYLARGGDLGDLRFEPTAEHKGFMVGLYGVDAAAQIEELAAALPLPSDEGLTLLREAYSHTTLSDAMGRLLARSLGPRGLLVIEGMEPELKRMALPLWEKVLDRGPLLGEMLRTRSEELKQQQWVTPLEPTPDSYLFYLAGEDHIRHSLSYDGKLRTPGGQAETLTHREIKARVRAGEVSPKAALRPLYQDVVLPSVAYVAGPGELDYHAQLTPLYTDLGVAAPSLFPRLSATLLDAKTAKAVEKLGVTYDKLLGEDKQALIRELLREEDDQQTAQLFDLVRYTIEALYAQLRPALAEIDPTLDGALHGATGKSLHPLNELQQKTERALKQKYGTLLARLDKTLTALKPEGKIAERVLSTGYYLAKFSPEMLLEALDQLPTELREHWVIEMEQG